METAVSGPGRWLLVNEPTAVLTFNAACTQLNGDMLLKKGTLEVNADVSLSGNLTYGFASAAPKIKVAQGAISQFSVVP